MLFTKGKNKNKDHSLPIAMKCQLSQEGSAYVYVYQHYCELWNNKNPLQTHSTVN
jgi:hypothetical protein